MADSSSVTEVLEIMVSSRLWRYRWVELVFGHRESNWIRIYPVLDQPNPYFDFAYADLEEPTGLVAHIKREFGPCELIDWSHGRLACIRVNGSDKKRLANVINCVAVARFGNDAKTLTAYYEDEQRA
jgi:hypothetical protein